MHHRLALLLPLAPAWAWEALPRGLLQRPLAAPRLSLLRLQLLLLLLLRRRRAKAWALQALSWGLVQRVPARSAQALPRGPVPRGLPRGPLPRGLL